MGGKIKSDLSHDHAFGQDRVRPGERKTLVVIAITAVMMAVEIAAGWLFGSMALLADGLHMASHAAALSITAFAYVYARRNARNPRFSFGTGKVNALGGFAGAILLALFALLMAGESVRRFIFPVPIAFNQAILVAFVGLLVNGLSVFILDDRGHHHEHDHGHHHGHDHNLRSAYLHVLADALTSVLAILALLAGKLLGWNFMDPLMGVVGALLVSRWSFSLVRDTSKVLLDAQAPESVVKGVKEAMEQDGRSSLTDAHVWSIGPGIYAAALTIVTNEPRPADYYVERMPAELGIVHQNIEVRSTPEE